MYPYKILSSRMIYGLALNMLLFLAYSHVGRAESIDELYEKAKKEGGKLVLYAPLSTRTQEVVLPTFEKRFPGIKIDHIDATSDALVTRARSSATYSPQLWRT